MGRKNIKKQLLFCPGPVNLADNVKTAAIQADICHREKDFEQLIHRLKNNVLKVLEIKHNDKYSAVFVTGSGTAGNEAILSSLGSDKRILVLTNGEFGERLLKIAKIHHSSVNQLNFGWGEKIYIMEVEKYLKTHTIDVIVMVHHETSSGMLNPIEEIGHIADKHAAQFIVDAVSSATAEKIDMENSHITFLNTSSGKAIGSFPGIALVVGEIEAFEALAYTQPKTAYLNLYSFYKHATTFNQTPNTPGVQLFFALDQAITNILREGIVARREHIHKLAIYLRKGMLNMDLTFLLNVHMSSVVTCVYLPAGLPFATLQTILRKKNIIIYNGKGFFKDKLFQVGHIGKISRKDADYFLSSLQEIITKVTVRQKQKSFFFSLETFFQQFPRAITALF
jgi:2-aminoethylphosphonate-pyruvate transaminase